MNVDVWSDIVCPWCYIGKARLQHALADFPHRQDVEVVFRSYQLDPSFPVDQAMPVLEMFAQKYGATPEKAIAAESRMAELARHEGLPYSGERSHGNTATVHRLLQHAGHHGRQEHLLDLVYRNHFGGKASIFDAQVLVDLAEAAGLDRNDARDVIVGSRYLDAVEADMDAARQLGIRGVPFFLVDGRLGVSGAQSIATLREVLDHAWAERH